MNVACCVKEQTQRPPPIGVSMRRIAYALALVVSGWIATAPAVASDSGRTYRFDRQTAKDVSQLWFDAVIGGDVKEASRLSATPFWWDGKQLIETTHELEARYERIASEVGRRTIVPERVERLRDVHRAEQFCGPNTHAEVFVFLVGRVEVGICVLSGPRPRVVGFGD